MTPLKTIVNGSGEVRVSRLILTAAFCVTAIILFGVLPNFEGFFAGRYSLGFADGYDLIANNLAQGNGYRLQANMAETMIREPGYPLFLAAIFKICGYRIEPARWANWLLMIGIALMLMRLATIVTNNSRTALIASLLFVFYPGTLIAEARAGVEILFIFIVLAFLLVLYRAIEKDTFVQYFVAGLLLGAALELRGTLLLVPVFLLVYKGLEAKNARARLRVGANVGILVVGMTVAMAPWIIRNYALVHKLVPGGSIRGIALQGGQFTCRNLSRDEDFRTVLTESGIERAEVAGDLGLRVEDARYAEPVFYDARDEVAFSDVLVQRGMQEYIKDPGFFAACAGKNLFYFFFLGKTWSVTWLNVMIQLPALLLALGGLYALWTAGLLGKMGIMLTLAFSFLAVHLPVVAEARYSLPLFAILAIPASVSIISIWCKCWNARGKEHLQ